MDKINFQDATLTSQAKVTIDNVDYEVTPPVYSGGTDLNAETLNYAFQLMHPVGSIFMTTIATNPSEIFGFGTWELWGAGKVPVGVDTTDDDFKTVEKTGGNKSHKHLTQNGMDDQGVLYGYLGSDGNPIYGSEIIGNVKRAIFQPLTISSNEPVRIAYTKEEKNLQPYITCYMFKRTA